MISKKIIINRITTFMILSSLLIVSAGCGVEDTEQTESIETIAPTENEGTEDSTDIENNIEETEDTEESEDKQEVDTVEIPSLRDCIMNSTGCTVGAALTESEMADAQVWELVTTHFNIVTFGNELKPDALFDYSVTTVPGTESYTWEDGTEMVVPKISWARTERMLDRILEWNEANPDRTIKVRGHVLVWHSQTPEWFFHKNYDKNEEYADKDEMNLRLEWYIKTVLNHFTGEDSKYKDLFYGWDVVNEAVSDSGGKLRTDAENPSEALSEDRHGSNSSWWHIYGNEEFIVNAFKYANKYAPAQLELYYNDYNECDAVKRSGIINLLEAIKAKEGEPGEGTRIDAMGMQGHYGMDNPSFSAVQSSIEAYGKVVGKVQITELDIQASSDYDGSEDMKADEYEKLRKRYNMLYFAMKAANDKPDVELGGITFWGTVDKYSWLQSRSDVGGGSKSSKKQCPLLFDDNYEPKPCFWVFTE